LPNQSAVYLASASAVVRTLVLVSFDEVVEAFAKSLKSKTHVVSFSILMEEVFFQVNDALLNASFLSDV